jgi:L-iditol 2-dehydrogenase
MNTWARSLPRARRRVCHRRTRQRGTTPAAASARCRQGMYTSCLNYESPTRVTAPTVLPPTAGSPNTRSIISTRWRVPDNGRCGSHACRHGRNVDVRPHRAGGLVAGKASWSSAPVRSGCSRWLPGAWREPRDPDGTRNKACDRQRVTRPPSIAEDNAVDVVRELTGGIGAIISSAPVPKPP